ncbi:uncharacterized protein LOC120626360 isoform X3 [Pararge aegeria]|uniref:Jg26155 protein n=1 Tax=Pararge aegeria aegeria TaxID=348720 RepID=A0A8S4S2X8_9NEOP|nr:uncharacterized protein LOC120626360 isoform X3 [Pararge aegeria]CAH2243682.1 jg26155 [Pararge aegeria aegeria]CAH2243683.1 jg26155 [Pararge aegeria aegeria]
MNNCNYEIRLQITQEDCLPNTICTECQKELNNFYEFRRKCNRTYHKLKNHLFAVNARVANELKAKQDQEKTEQVVDNTVCLASQSVCIEGPAVGQPLSQILDQSVNQPISTLVSQSVVVTKDQLILEFDDITQLAFVHFEPGYQNGFANNVENINGFAEGATINKGVEHITKEPIQANTPLEVCPDITEFLSSVLVEMGILKKQQNELQLMNEECKTIELETGDSAQITLEIVQIEEEEQKTIKKMRKVKGKTKNDDTITQKDESESAHDAPLGPSVPVPAVRPPLQRLQFAAPSRALQTCVRGGVAQACLRGLETPLPWSPEGPPLTSMGRGSNAVFEQCGKVTQGPVNLCGARQQCRKVTLNLVN